jgi:uncharacterized protein (TIGR04255 family)
MTTKKVVKKVYKRNFLKSVILRFDFDQADVTFLSSFSEKISKDYPFSKQDSEKSYLFEVKDNNVERIEEKNLYWQFSNPTQNKILKLASTSLTLEYQASYKSSKDLLETLNDVCIPFLNDAQVKTVNRIGLRYINYIDFKEIKKDFKLSDYLSKKLLSTIEFAEKIKGKVSRQMSQLSLKKEDTEITFNFGIWNNDFPSENTRNEFLMDIDCYSRFPIENNTADLVSKIEKYNLYVQDIFEKSITEKFRDFLNK